MTLRQLPLLAGLAAALFVSGAGAEELPPAPAGWVTDSAGFLSPSARQALDARLEAYERTSGHQILVWIGRSSGGVPIEDFAVRTFERWKVGRKGIDDGLVLFVFAADRKLRFEVGYGLEDRVPDAIASRIIREVIVPRLQAGDADGAIRAGMEAAIAAIGGGAAAAAPESPSRARTPAAGPERPRAGLTIAQIVLFGILAVGFLVLFITNPALAMFLLVQILSGGRGGGGGGGGGFSGGGGRSGGGGASGSW